MGISAKDVMALRQRTGLGMMDCKEALIEAEGDQDKAEELLRKKLKGKMDTRTERAAAEGRLAVKLTDDRKSVAVIELNTETDFTARNEFVAEQAEKIAAIALASSAGDVALNDQITTLIDEVRIKTGENASYRRGHKLEGACCGVYLHHDNKKAVIVSLSGDAKDEVIQGLCQHITAHVPTPMGVDHNDVPEAEVKRIREEAKQDAIAQGKPEEIAEKMVEGRVRKFLAENTLLGQKYVKDPEGKKTVKDILPSGVNVNDFVRYVVGL